MIRSDCYNSQEATMTQKKDLKKLSEAGYTTYILGGEFKATTEAIVGDETGVDTDNDVCR